MINTHHIDHKQILIIHNKILIFINPIQDVYISLLLKNKQLNYYLDKDSKDFHNKYMNINLFPKRYVGYLTFYNKILIIISRFKLSIIAGIANETRSIK